MLGEEEVKNIEDLNNFEIKRKINKEEQINENTVKEEANNKNEVNIEINKDINEDNAHNCELSSLNEEIKEDIIIEIIINDK